MLHLLPDNKNAVKTPNYSFMSNNARVVAHAFVLKGIEEGLPVTLIKLQKLVYVAHGIHLARYGEPLIKEYFFAWKYGPTVPAIFDFYRFYGSQQISHTRWLFDDEGLEDEIKSIDVRAQTSIRIAWETLKALNTAQISNWTRTSGSPWDKVYTKGFNDTLIPNSEIAGYFKQFRFQ